MALKLTGSWKRLSAVFAPKKGGARLIREVGKATKLNGLVVRRAIRARIRSGMKPGNAPLTRQLKGSSKPLVDHGDLFKAVTSNAISWNYAEVGILKKARGKKGEPLVNIAKALHEGSVIKVTPRMRAMFKALSRASTGAMPPSKLTGAAAALFKRRPGLKWAPLRESTKAIVVPARPFIRQAIEDPAVIEQVRRNWAKAIKAHVSAKGGA